jgi:hypothetical protein
LLLVAAVMAVMMSMGPALAYGSGSGGGGAGGAGGGVGGGQGGAAGGAGGHHVKNNNVYYVCHNGYTLRVTKQQRDWHLNHHRWDYPGACGYYYR